MRTVLVAAIAITGLLAMHLPAAAQEGSGREGEYFPVDPAKQADPRWWDIENPELIKSVDGNSNQWKLSMQLFSPEGKVLNETELMFVEGFPASVSNRRQPGSVSAVTGDRLEDYSFLFWVVPDELDEAFHKYGFMDWPDNRTPEASAGAGDAAAAADAPVLNAYQKRGLFQQALDASQKVSMHGLNFYFYSSTRVSQADIQLGWIAGGQGPDSAEPVAEFTLHFPANGGEWAGGGD